MYLSVNHFFSDNSKKQSNMLAPQVEKALNQQVQMEGEASQKYLAMACWCDRESLAGCAQFFYGHAEEERMHMLKLVNYINESGGFAQISGIAEPQKEFDNILDVFQTAYQHEKKVSQSIDELAELAEKEKDKQTVNFLQWYITEQHEEEALYRTVLDRIKLIGVEGRGLYFIDKEVESFAAVHKEEEN